MGDGDELHGLGGGGGGQEAGGGQGADGVERERLMVCLLIGTSEGPDGVAPGHSRGPGASADYRN